MEVEDIISMTFFRREPGIFYKWAKDVWYRLEDYEPNIVHTTLALMQQKGLLRAVFTQNIDMLHQKAGSSRVYEVHGSPIFHHCRRCGDEKSFDEIRTMIEANGGPERLGEPYVPRCACGGAYKPDITFFGESLPEIAFARSQELAIRADVMLVLGTSLTVFPAAGLPRLTLQRGGKLFIVNAQPTPLDDFAVARYDDLAAFAAAVTSALDAQAAGR
jgi:NAD-dependent deacetylase